MRLLLLITSIDALRYSVVLPSSKRLHKDAVRALQRGVKPINEREVGPSRLVFDAADDAPDRRDWRRLLRGPLSVRVVAAEAAVVDVGPDADAGGAADAIVDAIDDAVDWDAALGAWAAFGNAAGSTLGAHVRCQRFRSATWCPAGASPPLRRASEPVALGESACSSMLGDATLSTVLVKSQLWAALEEFEAQRRAHRWRHLVAAARGTKKAGVVLARLGAQAVARVAEKKRAAAKALPSSETPEDAKVGGAKETVVVGAPRSVAEGALVSASSGTGVRDAQGRSLVW